jgi:hypothetical protein
MGLGQMSQVSDRSRVDSLVGNSGGSFLGPLIVEGLQNGRFLEKGHVLRNLEANSIFLQRTCTLRAVITRV